VEIIGHWRLEAVFTGRQDGGLHVEARFQRASDSGILPRIAAGLKIGTKVPSANATRFLTVSASNT
jgi:hypothetical protein